MFTGIIKSKGHVTDTQAVGDDLRVHVDIGELSVSSLVIGDSVCVSGTCLTVVELTAHLSALILPRAHSFP